MKIKQNQIFTNLVHQGLTVNRISKNILSVSSNGEIPIEILLPDTFDLESKALSQLISFAHFKNHTGTRPKCACATPDFHTGSTVPVGTVVVTPESMVIPNAIGTDINCGMRLHKTGLSFEQFLSLKSKLLEKLTGDLLGGTRDIPVTAKAMTALFNHGLPEFWETIKKTPQGIFSKIDYEQVFFELFSLHPSSLIKGDSKYAPENLMNREIMRDPSMGTLGSGNHFLEFQTITEINDKAKAYELGLKVGDVVYMIHTGSRDVGFYIGNRWMDYAKSIYPKNLKHPTSKIYAIENEHTESYLQAMTSAAHYATLNRALLAEIVRQRIKELLKNNLDQLITDIPHNIIIKESIGNVHRKGATPAHEGQLLLIPGSMGHNSFLLSGLGSERWLQSASHGAGRKYSRNEISYQQKQKTKTLTTNSFECITLKEERKIEESPLAYKEIGDVIRSQTEEKIVQAVATFAPILTFKA